MGNVLITGGAGFIGSHLADYLADQKTSVIVLDKLTYAGDKKHLKQAEKTSFLTFVQGDVCDAPLVLSLLAKHDITTVYHLAAETHVDNSITDASPFVQTNVMGTQALLKAALQHWGERKKPSDFRLVHVSTDEVFGSLNEGEEAFTEQSPYAPNSPYAASKAAADHLVRAWFHTYGLPVIVTHCSNNYGSRQHGEKFIPTVIRNALSGSAIPIYGDGKNIRDWLHVEDHCRGLVMAAAKGVEGESYCFGQNNEWRNINLALKICALLDEKRPRKDAKSYKDQISFVADRQGHDRRYAINSSKALKHLDWQAEANFDETFATTCDYYIRLLSEK